MTALEKIQQAKNGNMQVLKSEPWLMYLYLTKRKDINLERVSSLKELEKSNPVLEYVENTLSILENMPGMNLYPSEKRIVEEVLKWSEVAKCGMPHHRIKWQEQGVNLFVHNIGSAQIYALQYGQNSEDIFSLEERYIIHTLIETHGLIGQYIRGEVNLDENRPLSLLLSQNYLKEENLKIILTVLNKCIIKGASADIWDNVEDKVKEVIEWILNDDYRHELSVKERMKQLRNTAIKNGENFEEEYSNCFTEKYEQIFRYVFSKAYLWYVESALSVFTLEEFLKIFLLIYKEINPFSVKHISFEYLMKEIYYDHKGRKNINLYKMRIIQHYLAQMTPEDILSGNMVSNEHVCHQVSLEGHMDSTACFSFRFSLAGTKLIEFCQVSDTSSVLFKQATMLLLDLFELRKDKFDRLYNEEEYLETMNQSLEYKTVVADYIPEQASGNTIIDIGPGKGALMDYIVDKFPASKVIGVDMSQNVIDELKKIKNTQGKQWDFIKGDVRNLSSLYKTAGPLKEYLMPGAVKSVIFCSVAHEIFSYNGFSYKALEESFTAAFDLLCVGGRLIIRDGIMTEQDEPRIIRFKSSDDMKFVEQYAKDFKGRKIEYRILSANEVMMPVNDCMEMLYTYTWGSESYAQEVQEQFGYFTPSEFQGFLSRILGKQAKIIECKHYLQKGYEEHLLPKVEIFDKSYQPVSLPDSTCLIVVEKTAE